MKSYLKVLVLQALFSTSAFAAVSVPLKCEVWGNNSLDHSSYTQLFSGLVNNQDIYMKDGQISLIAKGDQPAGLAIVRPLTDKDGSVYTISASGYLTMCFLVKN